MSICYNIFNYTSNKNIFFETTMKIASPTILLIITAFSITQLMAMQSRRWCDNSSSFFNYMEDKKKRDDEVRIERQKALVERRELNAKSMQSLQQISMNHLIDSLLKNLDKISDLKAMVTYCPSIQTIFLDRIEAQKGLLDVDDAEELKKIEKLNQLKTAVNPILEEENKEIQNSSEKEEEKPF